MLYDWLAQMRRVKSSIDTVPGVYISIKYTPPPSGVNFDDGGGNNLKGKTFMLLNNFTLKFFFIKNKEMSFGEK